MRDNCIALLEGTPEGLKIVATPGWLMAGAIGVLVEQSGRPVFQYKSETVEATPERLETLRRFREDLRASWPRQPEVHHSYTQKPRARPVFMRSIIVYIISVIGHYYHGTAELPDRP